MALRGTLADLGIIDLIQFPHSGRKSGKLVIVSDGKEAELYYEKGALVHAILGHNQGMDALVGVIDWQEGSFEFIGDEQPPAKTIEMDLHRAVMQALKLHDEMKAEEQSRQAAQEAASSEDLELIGKRIEEYVASSDFVLHVCLLAPDGSLRAGADGRDGTPDGIEQLRATLHSVTESYPRPSLKRCFVVDELGTVVLARFDNGSSLMVVASKEAPLGAVSMSVNKLAISLELGGTAQ